MTFGALSLAGGSLTMASIAVLPVLIGLAVDYAIQFQARFDEAARRASGDAAAAAAAAAAAGGPTIVTAGVATAVGFLVLLLSPVPMVRGFGALLVVGHRARARCARSAPASPRWCASAGRRAAPSRRRRALPRLARARPPRCTAAREWLADRAWRTLGVALARPRRVLGDRRSPWPWLGLALDTQSEVVSDVRELVPQDLQALQDVNVLQDETGVSGEIDVTVRADDITDARGDRAG